MENVTNSPVLVQKEDISNLLFPAKEVLSSGDDIKIRRSDLERATKLGNAERGKIKIIFEDKEGIKKVETTIWATTEKNIILKGGVFIPIHRIHQINIY
ncbi:MAG: hypothetical protein H0V01_07220 [Bacteroidetes bacterium]|nr:hypothetical protein [Bacteroidota bacterium]HET6244148.1 hypothetical protein [Bacteroidia bacterium]